jgi:hypothetical protein
MRLLPQASRIGAAVVDVVAVLPQPDDSRPTQIAHRQTRSERSLSALGNIAGPSGQPRPDVARPRHCVNGLAGTDGRERTRSRPRTSDWCVDPALTSGPPLVVDGRSSLLTNLRGLTVRSRPRLPPRRSRAIPRAANALVSTRLSGPGVGGRSLKRRGHFASWPTGRYNFGNRRPFPSALVDAMRSFRGPPCWAARSADGATP